MRWLLLLGLAGCFDNYDREDVAEVSVEVMDSTISRISFDFTPYFPQRLTVGPREGFTISAAPDADYPVALSGSGSFVGTTISAQVHAELDHYFASGYNLELTGALDFTVQLDATPKADDAFAASIWVGAGRLTGDVTARWKAEGAHDLDVTRCWNDKARGFSGTVDGEYTRNIQFDSEPDCVTPRSP